jgi:hypothetical protein
MLIVYVQIQERRLIVNTELLVRTSLDPFGSILATSAEASSMKESVACAVTRLAMLVAVMLSCLHFVRRNGRQSLTRKALGRTSLVDPFG